MLCCLRFWKIIVRRWPGDTRHMSDELDSEQHHCGNFESCKSTHPVLSFSNMMHFLKIMSYSFLAIVTQFTIYKIKLSLIYSLYSTNSFMQCKEQQQCARCYGEQNVRFVPATCFVQAGQSSGETWEIQSRNYLSFILKSIAEFLY